jgi:hypothetical protein
MNTHEKLYMHMSIIVLVVLDVQYCIVESIVYGVIPSIRSNLWCYPTLRIISIFMSLLLCGCIWLLLI